jgi:hypothetical protein
MTGEEITAQIIAWGKHVSTEEVRELIVSRANVADLPRIRAALVPYVSSNETNAADDALFIIDHLPGGRAQ